MKASTVIAVAAGLSAYTVSAQLDQLPTCALNCAVQGLGASGCPNTDVACICQAATFISGLVPCVQAACDAAQLAATIQAATALCRDAGVNLSVPPVGGSSSTAAPSSTESSSAPVVSTTEAVVYPPVTNATSTEEPMPEPTEEPTTAPTNATSVTPPEPSETGSASRNAVALGGLGALVAFVAALL